MEGFKDVFGRKLNWIFLFRFHEVKVKPKLKLKPGPIWSNELSFFFIFLMGMCKYNRFFIFNFLLYSFSIPIFIYSMLYYPINLTYIVKVKFMYVF